MCDKRRSIKTKEKQQMRKTSTGPVKEAERFGQSQGKRSRETSTNIN